MNLLRTPGKSDGGGNKQTFAKFPPRTARKLIGNFANNIEMFLVAVLAFSRKQKHMRQQVARRRETNTPYIPPADRDQSLKIVPQHRIIGLVKQVCRTYASWLAAERGKEINDGICEQFDVFGRQLPDTRALSSNSACSSSSLRNGLSTKP